ARRRSHGPSAFRRFHDLGLVLRFVSVSTSRLLPDSKASRDSDSHHVRRRPDMLGKKSIASTTVLLSRGRRASSAMSPSDSKTRVACSRVPPLRQDPPNPWQWTSTFCLRIPAATRRASRQQRPQDRGLRNPSLEKLPDEASSRRPVVTDRSGN